VSQCVVESHLGLVYKIARSVWHSINKAVEFEELVSMGVVGLLEAATRVDPKSKTFAGYAYLRVRGSICDALGNTAALPRKAHRRVRAGRLEARSFPVDSRELDELAGPPSCPSFSIDAGRAVQAIEGLPPRTRRIIRAVYLDGRSLTAVAGEMNLSVSRVSRVRDAGLGMLKRSLVGPSELPDDESE